MITIERHETSQKKDIIAGILVNMGLPGMEIPATLTRMPLSWNIPHDLGRAAARTAMFVFLLSHAVEKKSPVQNSQGVQS
ncbi:MAG TPA: hypothetical protein VHO84_11455 [Syntrophorhabdaceae bacterium]|nr:hypothetical protein [Syntrophorhabdaceae bacterium]